MGRCHRWACPGRVEATHTVFCSVCFQHRRLQDPCAICDNQRRDHGLICVVEEPLDVQTIERTRSSPASPRAAARSRPSEVEAEDLKVGELLQRIQQSRRPCERCWPPINLEGEATAMYIARRPSPLSLRGTPGGLPMGGDLEYADEVTLTGRALTGRSEM